MDITVTTASVITCAKPGCETQTTLAESTFIDGCGYVCPDCSGPRPEWYNDLEPPF